MSTIGPNLSRIALTLNNRTSSSAARVPSGQSAAVARRAEIRITATHAASNPGKGDSPCTLPQRRPRAGASEECQYLSDHFLKQIRYWGIHPSFGFVEEPETNGVAERWNRTLKEQAIHGRIFQNLEAVRAAVADFVERYNQTWRLEKLGYHTPIEAREEYELRQAA